MNVRRGRRQWQQIDANTPAHTEVRTPYSTELVSAPRRRGGHPRRTAAERLWLRIGRELDPNTCWPWTGSISPAGYGVLSIDRTGRKVMAHRVSYESAYGPIADGMVIDHVCHNADLTCLGGKTCLHRRCVNPGHLESTDRRENVRRGFRRMSTCMRQHELSGNNLIIERGGLSRRCRQCRLLGQARRLLAINRADASDGVDLDLEPGSPVADAATGERGEFLGIAADGKFEVRFENDKPGFIDRVSSNILVRAEW